MNDTHCFFKADNQELKSRFLMMLAVTGALILKAGEGHARKISAPPPPP